ncbi:MAG: M28 family metallopeptidase [Nitrososphaerales archaeon]
MEISEDNLRKHVSYLASNTLQGRAFGSEGNNIAAQYIRNHFKEYGLEAPTQFFDYIQKLPEGGQNVIGILHGSDTVLSRECVIIEAHHDHMGDGFVGASDNAAGVAVLLELARIFAADKDKNKRSLLFVCFDAEEQLVSLNGKQQLMYGAYHYLKNPVFDLKKTISMLTIDTVGRNDLQGNLIFILGSERSLFIQEIIYGCSTDLHKIMFNVDMLTGVKGNYVPFIEKKIPSLFISNGIHQDYHSKNDTGDKLQYELLAKDIELLCKLIRSISNSSEKPDFCNNPICPKSEVEDILYLLKLLQELVRRTNGNAENFNYIIGKLEEKPSKKDLKQAVQILLGFMTPNFAKFYLLLNKAQMEEKEKEYAIALKHYQEIIALYDQYRMPHVWMEEIKDKIARLEARIQ